MPVNTPFLGPGGTANTPVGQVAPTIGVFSAQTESTSVQPPFNFASEVSLGLFRSGASTIAQSYGTLRLPPLVDGFTNVTKLSLTTFSSAAGMVVSESLLKVNGKDVTADVPPDTPLLWVLRDTLHLTGTKFGCGIGQCGACTVHIDGVAQKSCQFPFNAVAGKSVTTIE